MSGWLFLAIVTNELYMICLRNENKIYTVLYTGTELTTKI